MQNLQKRRLNKMKDNFYYFHKQNELCIKLALLPFTIVFWLIKKLVQAIAKRLRNKKH